MVTISNIEKKQFFFSTDHCQNHGLSNDWVSCSSRLPMFVAPREGLESGYVTNKEEYKFIFYNDCEEIPNPQPEFQG